MRCLQIITRSLHAHLDSAFVSLLVGFRKAFASCAVSFLYLAIAACPSALGQATKPGMQLGTYPATQALNQGNISTFRWTLANASLNPNGTLYLTYTGITGSPAGCFVALDFGNTSVTQFALTFTIVGPTQSVTPGSAPFALRISAANEPYISYTTVAPTFFCATYPTGGTIGYEFVPDTQAAPFFQYSHITTLTSTVLKNIAPGMGQLHTIVINQAGTGVTLTVFDNTTCTGTSIAILTTLTTGQTYGPYDLITTTGLCILTAGTTAGDYTVTYR